MDLQEASLLNFPQMTAECSALSWKLLNFIEDKSLLYQIGQKALASFDTEGKSIFDLIFFRSFAASLFRYCENTVSPTLRQKIAKPSQIIRCICKFLKINSEESEAYRQTLINGDIPEHSLLALDLLTFSTAVSIIV
jgi:hypothetical protein